MNFLVPPSRDAAVRMLRTVLYADRLRAGRMRPPVGLIKNDIRSLLELERLLAPEPHGLPGLDFAAAAAWVERELGDPELAGLVRREAARDVSYVDRCLGIHTVVALRLAQAREAAGDDPSNGKEA